MDQPKFVIEASEAQLMAQSLSLPSILHLLPTLVQPAQSLARPPISNFHVAAVGLGSDGRIYIGVNVEFPKLPLHHSIHAEQFLITNLSFHNCPSLIAFAVSAAPCGHCRQFLQELRHSSSLKICITSENVANFKPLSELLPSPFGPFDLLDDQKPLLLEVKNNGLILSPFLSNGYSKRLYFYSNSGDLSNGYDFMNKESKRLDFYSNSENLSNGNDDGYDFENKESKRLDFSSNSEDLSNGYCKELEKETLLIDEGLKAANSSHAPYSGCPSGVALMDCDGNVYRGSYAESAAYNPSMGPVQAALVAFVAGGGGGYERIVAAVLVEKEGAAVVQEDTARIILKKVAPKCDLKVIHCFYGENGK